MSIFPWHKKQWQQLIEAREANQLPHALLFHGLTGLGKVVFAHAFVRTLLCQQPTSDAFACDACHACRLTQGGVHPNLIHVRPETEGHPIKVDQIRAANEFVYQSALQGRYRIVLIDHADNMNVNAANALLKTLEEPTADVILILISDQRHRLLATILSRCQQITFARPPMDEALKWLEGSWQQEGKSASKLAPALALRLTDGAPLLALQLMKEDVLHEREALFQAIYAVVVEAADPVKAAAGFQKMDSIVFVDLMLRFIQDCLRLQLSGEIDSSVEQTGIAKIHDIASRVTLDGNLKLLDTLQAIRKQIIQGINLNKQLLVEKAMLTLLE